MIADLVILQRGENHEDGFKLPIILLNGQKYRVFPTFIEAEVSIYIRDFVFQRGATYLIFRRKEFITITEGHYYNSRNYSTFKIESIENLRKRESLYQLSDIVGNEQIFYQLIPMEI